MKNKGITLIALVITIVVLIILAGVTLNLTLGENGIFKKSEAAKRKENEATAREKVEIVLVDARIEKETNTNYNKEDFLNEMIEQSGITVEDDMVISDNYTFLIDREKLQIVESLGETLIGVTKEVQSYLGTNEEGKYEVSVLVTIQTETNIQSVVITNPDGTTTDIIPEGMQASKSIDIELDETYIITATTVDGKTGTRKLIEKSVEGIRTVEELVAFRDKVNTGLTYEGKTINLLKDLDLSSVCGENINGEKINWIPIGTETNPFKSTFDGQEHIISNCYINDDNLNNQGLIGVLEGTVKNIQMENINISSTNGTAIGGLVGKNDGGTIYRCSSKGDVDGLGSVGGISGISYGGKIIECYNKSTIEGTKTSSNEGNLGGIVGSTAYECEVLNCYNVGTIDSLSSWTGGITGAATRGSKIRNCYNAGTIKAGGTQSYIFLGGIIGNTYYDSSYGEVKVEIKNCYNLGEITINNTTTGMYIGGIAGYIQNGYAEFLSCYNSGNIYKTTGSNSGGIIGYIINAPKITINNIFTTTSTAIGLNSATSANATLTNVNVSQTAMPSVLDVVNSDTEKCFTQDKTNINQGYPILKWEIEE